MYRLMIADDEEEERLGIRFLLNRCGISFEIVEAVDGQDALKKLNDFPADILLTDVKMPFLDGIGLATEAKKRIPGIQLIFFSGYDDFDYVRQALSLQAVDYILKPVNPAEFENTLRLVVERIRRAEEEDANNRQFTRNYVLTRLLSQVPMEKLRLKYDGEKLKFAEGYSRLLLMEFDEDFFGCEVTDIRGFAERFAAIVQDEFDFLDVNSSQGVFFLGEKYQEAAAVRELAKCIHLMVDKEYKKRVYLSVSPKIGSPDELAAAYKEAESDLENRFFYKDIFVYPMDAQREQETVAAINEGQLLGLLEKDISGRDCFSLRRDMNMILEKCRNNGFQSYIYTRFVCANLLQVLFKGISDSEDRMTAAVEKSYGCTTFAELELLLWQVVDELEEQMLREQDTPKHTIAMVEQYIKEHYDEILSLDILADKVYLTPHYLSSIFIQEKNIGINKYIKNVRMEKARELLLETNMKINDICEKVGYSNLSYFCRCFRNEYGVTPDQYRK